MGDWTRANLKDDVEDMAPRFGYAPNMEARFATGALGLESSAVSYQRVAPGFRIPFGHRHEEQEELYVFLSGGGRLRLDDEVVEGGRLDAVRIGAQVVRGFEAGPEGAALLAIGAPNRGAASVDAVPVPDFWTD